MYTQQYAGAQMVQPQYGMMPAHLGQQQPLRLMRAVQPPSTLVGQKAKGRQLTMQKKKKSKCRRCCKCCCCIFCILFVVFAAAVVFFGLSCENLDFVKNQTFNLPLSSTSGKTLTVKLVSGTIDVKVDETVTDKVVVQVYMKAGTQAALDKLDATKTETASYIEIDALSENNKLSFQNDLQYIFAECPHARIEIKIPKVGDLSDINLVVENTYGPVVAELGEQTLGSLTVDAWSMVSVEGGTVNDLSVKRIPNRGALVIVKKIVVLGSLDIHQHAGNVDLEEVDVRGTSFKVVVAYGNVDIKHPKIANDATLTVEKGGQLSVLLKDGFSGEFDAKVSGRGEVNVRGDDAKLYRDPLSTIKHAYGWINSAVGGDLTALMENGNLYIEVE